MKKAIVLFLIILTCLTAVSCSKKKAEPESRFPTLTIKGTVLYIEKAVTDEERQHGLMHRKKLPANQGMLFVYSEERILSFWMKNTYIPLSIAYIDSKGIIVDIQDMKPETEDSYPSKKPALYALEVNQGWYAEHNITVGDKVEGLPK
jgi:uncharacterized membrane protein (UPF0127 family)